MSRWTQGWGRGLLVLALIGLAWPAGARKKKKADPSQADAGSDPSAQAKLDDAPEVPAGPSLVVLPLSLGTGHEGQAALAGFLAEQAVRDAKRNALVSLDDALDPQAAATRTKATAEGLRQLKAAHHAFDQLDMDVSSDLANRAIGSLTKGDLVRTFPKIVDAYELRVAAFASDPKTLDRAQAELGNLLPIDPRGELSPNLFNPDVISLAEGIRTKVKAGSTLTLKVTTTPASARVFVDGMFRGVSPVEVQNLAPGNHYVTVVDPGFHQVMKRVNPGPDPALDLTLEPAEKAADLKSMTEVMASSFHAPKIDTVVARVATTFNAEQALVVVVEDQKPNAARAYAERGTALPVALLDDLDQPLPSATADATPVLSALFADALTRDHAISSQRAAPIVADSHSSGGGSGVRYAGFGLIGAGVAAAVVGAVFGSSAHSDASQYTSTVQLDTARSSSLSSSGKSNALIANVAFGGAVVLGGVGALMAALGGGSAKAAPAESGSATSHPDEGAKAPPPSHSDSTAKAPPPAASSSSSSSSSTSPPPSQSKSPPPIESKPPPPSQSTPPPSQSTPPPKSEAPPASSSPPPASPPPASTPASTPPPSSSPPPAKAAPPPQTAPPPSTTPPAKDDGSAKPKVKPKDLGDDIKEE